MIGAESSFQDGLGKFVFPTRRSRGPFDAAEPEEKQLGADRPQLARLLALITEVSTSSGVRSRTWSSFPSASGSDVQRSVKGRAE